MAISEENKTKTSHLLETLKMPIDEGQKSKMSIHSSGYDKSIEKINIFIKKCKNLVNIMKIWN